MRRSINIRKLFSVSVTISCLLVLCIVPPSSAWQTKDPQLAEDFVKLLGFKTQDKVGKVAPEIKPGIIIDASNYKDYPGLKELLPMSIYNRLNPDSYAPLAPIKIKETDQYHLSRGWITKSLESAKTAHLGQDGVTLEGYKAGYAFINPQKGIELAQWADKPYLGDSFAMRPMRLRLYNNANKPEREMRQHLNVLRFMHRTDWGEDIQPNPDQVHYIVSGVFIYPRDISGTSYVRKRFAAADRADEFLLYVASMRRIRRMSGRDTQDPLFGSDLVWDDYNIYWQKISTNEFPNDYNMLPSREMLVPTFLDYDWPNDRSAAGYNDYRVDESSDQTYLHFGTWQRRWVHMLEVISKDPSYTYSKRVIAFEPENCTCIQEDLYDQNGRLWRAWAPRDYNLSEAGGGIMEDFNDIIDYVNMHRTILDFKGEKNPRWMGAEYGDVRYLSKKAK